MGLKSSEVMNAVATSGAFLPHVPHDFHTRTHASAQGCLHTYMHVYASLTHACTMILGIVLAHHAVGVYVHSLFHFIEEMPRSLATGVSFILGVVSVALLAELREAHPRNRLVTRLAAAASSALFACFLAHMGALAASGFVTASQWLLGGRRREDG